MEKISWCVHVALVQFLSKSLLPPQTAARQASLSFTISHSSLKLMSTELVICIPEVLIFPLGILIPEDKFIKFT